MRVTFSGKHTVNSATFGITFEARVDGVSVVCMVSNEALQDINPTNALGTVKDKFTSNRAAFERIAARKIRDGQPAPISITITDA